MNTTVLAVLGIASGALNIIGIIPYVRDIFLKKTKPERATWWIWLALNIIALAALVNAGATWQLPMNIAQALSVGIVAVLSVKYGYGKLHKKDVISLLIALLGVIAWVVTKEPLVALLIVVGIDLSGLWLTIEKTWKDPETETYSAWVLATLSGILGVVAVGELNFTKLLYPVYISFADGFLAWIIFYKLRAAKKR